MEVVVGGRSGCVSEGVEVRHAGRLPDLLGSFIGHSRRARPRGVSRHWQGWPLVAQQSPEGGASFASLSEPSDRCRASPGSLLRVRARRGRASAAPRRRRTRFTQTGCPALLPALRCQYRTGPERRKEE